MCYFFWGFFMLIKEVFLYRMKHINEAIAALFISMMVFISTPIYASSLPEALNAQVTIEHTQEENNDTLVYFVNTVHEVAEEQLAEIKAETQQVAAEVERVRICTEQTQRAQPIVDATYTTPTTGSGWCASWVSHCYSTAGFSGISGNACDMYWKYCSSSNRDEIIPGMVIAVPSHTGTYLGTRYGHIGIIVAHDGQYWVRHNVGPIEEVSLDEWIAEYGTTYEPKWGFATQI